MSEGGFPQSLLQQPVEARMAYFRSFTIAHPRLKEADTALKQAIQDPAGWSLIFVYGPTGVGKTTLRLRVERHFKQSLLAALKDDPGRIPVISIEAAADSAQFSWKDYYRRALIALEEPLIDHKISYRVRGVFRDNSGRLTLDSRAAGLEIRYALESALIHRRPAAFFVDEAQHLAKMSSGRKLQDQLDSIKSLANLTNTVHVLVGTYELLPFRNLSAQLSRRSIDIHFPRYRADRHEDRAAFQSVLFTFQRHLPLRGESDLLQHLDYCYERSVGCVGVLKDWLMRALALALTGESPVITRKILEQTAWSVCQCERMAKEALEGEADLVWKTKNPAAGSENCCRSTQLPPSAQIVRFRPAMWLGSPVTLKAAWANVGPFETLLASVMEPHMPVEDMVEYESWDLTDVALPPHSRLYHLDPIAFGTGSVESLTSYFSRLAEAHSVSAGALNHRVLLPLNAGRRNMFSCVVTARTRCFTSTINSIGHTAARFASVVGRLTGRTDLTHLTMLPWKPVLPTQLLTRGVAAWCPQCLNGWRKGGKTIHMPLLWALEVVKFCPDHRCTLQMVCTNCGKPQPLLGQCCPLGHCTRCKKWLGAEGPADRGARYSLLPSESPDWEVWAASQVKDLVRAGFDSPALLSRQQLSRLLWFATGAEGLGSFSRIVGVSPTSVTEWRSGQKLPMLPVYLRIARTLNVPLTDLLTGKVEPDSIPSLDVRQVPYWRSIRLHQKPSFDAGKAEQLLREALQESPPPSFLAFQKRTGYHYWTLHKHFPELCKLLRDRFQQHQAAVIAKRQQNKIAEFKNIAYQLHDQGIDLFVHRVLNRMSVPKSLNYRLARELLLEVKREILAREQETVQCFHARS